LQTARSVKKEQQEKAKNRHFKKNVKTTITTENLIKHRNIANDMC